MGEHEKCILVPAGIERAPPRGPGGARQEEFPEAATPRATLANHYYYYSPANHLPTCPRANSFSLPHLQPPSQPANLAAAPLPRGCSSSSEACRTVRPLQASSPAPVLTPPGAGKRNTSRAVFTSHERALAKSSWSTSSARLNRDSFLPFGSCGLCLGIAREPVCCPRGDVFCRECALANLVAQKKELKRADKARDHAEREARRLGALEDEQDRERAVRDFEMAQAGLSAAARPSRQEDVPRDDEPPRPASHAGAKRKFTLDGDELDRIARQDRLKARKAIEDEKASKHPPPATRRGPDHGVLQAAKPTLPSFWTPSLTPSVHDSKLPDAHAKAKPVPTCPSAPDDKPHHISLHKLTTIRFNQDTDPATKSARRTCPSCLKVLSNASNAVMMQQCGHVLCMSCVKKFLVAPSKGHEEGATAMACFVCDMPVADKAAGHGDSGTSLPPGLVALKSEGTGFSARGSSVVQKAGVAFQC